jgi:predicted nucleic-acid-binding protein
MIGIDTNVLVRFLVNDDPTQSAMARDLVAKFGRDGLFVTLISLAELVWVLKRTYKIEASTILDSIERLLSTREFRIERAELAVTALGNARASNAGFADALIEALGTAAGCELVASFDVRAKRLPAMRNVADLL